jgi:hypothetical protein
VIRNCKSDRKWNDQKENEQAMMYQTPDNKL